MIDVKVIKDNNKILFEVKGHAGYAEHGKDIVCASVSTACLMTANLIECLNLGYNITNLVSKEGLFILEFKLNDTLIAIANNLEYTFSSLSKQYPRYIKYNL